MKIIKKILMLTISLLLFAGSFAYADTKVFKGKDFTVSVKDGKIVFELARDGAKAAIPGFFNGWKPDAPEAQMTKKDGKFYLEMDVEKFAAKKPYEFKFFVDGNWDPDPNGSLNLKKKGGEWVFAVSPTAKVKSNTKANASIMFKGHFTSLMPMQMDVMNVSWNASGDDGIYMNDAKANFDLDLHYKIGESVLGFTRLKVGYDTDGTSLYFDTMSGKFFTDDVLLKVFFKARDNEIHFDNPTQLLRKFIDTDYNGISFVGEDNSELYDFGRQYAGLYLKVASMFDLQIIGARKFDESYSIEKNDFFALRLKPINTKTMTLGLFGLYAVNSVAWDSLYMAAQNGARYVNPYRINILTGYYNYVGGVDISMRMGSLKVFAEGKVVSTDGVASTTAPTGGSSLMNIVATGGLQYKSNSMIAEVFGSYYKMDVEESMAIVTGKLLFKLNGSFKGTIAAAVTAVLPETSDMILEQRLEVKLKSNLFDPWFYESFRMLENGIGDVYNLVDVKAGIDWYFNAKLVAVFGVRFMSDGNSANSASYAYSAITPIVGVKYSFSKDINFSVFYGRDLDYTAYLEDNSMTVESAAPWNGLGSDYYTENKVAGLHRITLKMDMKF